MKSLASIGSFLWAHLLILLALVCTGHSFKQELWLYDAHNTSIHFESHVADTSDFSLFLPKVTRACVRGLWDLFSTVDFQTYSDSLGSYSVSEVVCSNFTTASSVKSLRHHGAIDTDTNGLSLYEGPNASGKVLLVTAQAHTGITNKIFSFGVTGTSEWMFFDGQELDGNSTCCKLPSGYNVYWATVGTLNLATIGSVLKGCDVQEIQNYKMLHQSSFVNSN